MSTGTPDAGGGGVSGVKIEFSHKFEEIISLENLLAAWREFVRGKRSKRDVQLFARDLYQNILALHQDLTNKTYRHGDYHHFNISDPKPRNISKASVRDRLLHHAVYRILYPFFDQIFIHDSYSCRINKGTHKAIQRFHSMFLEVSDYDRRTCWVLKLDIKKFFASIDHETLKSILARYIPDENILWLLDNIIDSFGMKGYVQEPSRNFAQTRIILGRNIRDLGLDPGSPHSGLNNCGVRDGLHGLPLGNLTSQLLVNVYMNEFDQFVKHKLKAKYYIRYADDFVLLSHDKLELTRLLSPERSDGGQVNQHATIEEFLNQKLKLTLHPNKIVLKTFASGIDFLGWVNFPDYRILRTASKRRALKRLNKSNLHSYLGLISHGQTHKIRQQILNKHWLLTNE